MTFCSRASLAAHEQMAGTAVRADAYLFLPVQKRLWHDNEFNGGWASAEEIAAIRACRREGIVTRLYNPDRDHPGDDGALIFRPTAEAPPALAELLGVLGGRWPVDMAPGPTLAICTHGTRDRCCAKWGFAAVGAARALFEQGASPFRPLECSHLGGDRFAATGVVFPSGSMYAHLDSADLAALAAAEAAGRLTPEIYRGRVFDPPLLQVVRGGLARAGLVNDASAPMALVAREAMDAQVRLGADLFDVSLREAEVRFYGSCEKMAAGIASKARRLLFEGARLR